MSLPSVMWSLLILLHAGFVLWYTSLGGPLSDTEIERYVGILSEQGSSAEEIARVRAFLEADTGDDFVMVNLIEMRDEPTPIEGVPADASAADLLDRYMAHMYPALFSRACHPVLFGEAAAAALDLWGIENARHWTLAGMMRYRSRRDMMEIATHPAFHGPHEFKIAAMSKTIAFPIDPWIHGGDPRLVLGLAFAVVGLLVHGLEGHRRARRRARGA